MNGRSIVVAAAVSALAGIVAGVIACVAFGDFYVIEVLSGAAFGVAFFAVSALVVMVARLDELKHALLATYVIKVSVLASIGLLLASFSLHRATFAVALVSAALAYLATSVRFAQVRSPVDERRV